MDADVAVTDAVEQPLEQGGGEATYDEAEDSQHEIAPVEGGEEPSEGPSEIEPREPTPKDVADALKALKQLDPKYARVVDRMRKDFFETDQYRSGFPSAREAKAAKLAFDSVGGVEGIATLREQVQASEYLEQAAEVGDSSIIEDWSKDYPDGFKSAMPYAIEKYAQMDQQGFSQAIQPHVYGVLDRAQLGQRLEEMWNAVGSDNKPAAQQLIQNIYSWLSAQAQQSRQNGVQTKSPGEEKLVQRENQVKQQEERLFLGEIGRDTYRYQQESVEKALAPYLKGSKISSQARTRLSSAVASDINDNLKADEGYQRQVKAFIAKKDAKGTATYIKGHLDSIIPSIARRAWADLYGPAPKAAKAATLNTTNGQKPPPITTSNAIRVAKKPAMNEIVKNAGYMESYIAGRAIMASGPNKGRMVRWK